MPEIGESLRQAMRRWTTGVSIVTSQSNGYVHGMTVNSFTSVSLEPAYVTVTLANQARTYSLVRDSGIFAVTILSDLQAEVADRFAGKIPEDRDRFEGLETTQLVTGAPLLVGGLAFIDCKVVQAIPLDHSTLFVGQVLAAWQSEALNPLVYFNRIYHRLERERTR
jgi:flavin reductase (DIM6/NTAB) family NADH-FMN oxidoreductase RutF